MTALPLYKSIINDLRQDILDGKLRPGDRIPSEAELCAAYMVSSITAKNALADLAGNGYIVRQKGKGSFVNTQELLMNIQTFHHTMASRSLFAAKTIGLIIPSMKTGIDQLLLNYIEEEISRTDYLLTVVITRENQERETRAIETLKEQGANGLIIFPAEHEIYNNSIIKLNMENYPFVLIDRYLKGIRTSTVCTNNYEITREAVHSMLKASCRNLLFISPESRNTVTEERFSGFRDTLLENQMEFSSHNACLIPLEITASRQKKALIEKILRETPAIDGIFCVNQEIADYVIELSDENRWWNRYQICAFDYTGYKKISYIMQDIKELSKQCVQVLLNSINGNAEPVQLRIPARLVTEKTLDS